MGEHNRTYNDNAAVRSRARRARENEKRELLRAEIAEQFGPTVTTRASAAQSWVPKGGWSHKR